MLLQALAAALVLRRRALLWRASSRRTATGEVVPAAILRDGHVQQAARDLLRMRSVACVRSIAPDWFHGVDALRSSRCGGFVEGARRVLPFLAERGAGRKYQRFDDDRHGPRG